MAIGLNAYSAVVADAHAVLPITPRRSIAVKKTMATPVAAGCILSKDETHLTLRRRGFHNLTFRIKVV